MKHLYQFLKKTVFSVRRTLEAHKSKIRLSLTLRISWNYVKLLLLNGVVFFAVFAVLYIGEEKKDYTERAESMLIQIERKDKNRIDVVQRQQNMTFRILDEDGQLLYEDDCFHQEEQFHTDRNEAISPFTFDFFGEQQSLIVMEAFETILAGQPCEIQFEYNMTHIVSPMNSLFAKLVFVYLILTFFIIWESKNNNGKILQPIQDLSQSMTQLTMSNIHSERLNIEGTKNELKDLAVVFNDMLDRLELSYESQKQFVSDASHELRTPIAVIQGYAGMLARWGSSDKEVLQESIEAIQNEAKAMQDLVEKLLFLSRNDKKTFQLKKEKFDMQPVVEEMIKETELVAKNRNIECPALEHVIVYGDKQSLKQAIRVFIDNAIKYTDDGDTIRISCQNIQGDARIVVEDTGIGMTQKDLDHIFNRFYRSDHVRDKQIEGHGLGLSIAKLIILGHAGRIKIRTQYTKGTSFIVTLPKQRYS